MKKRSAISLPGYIRKLVFNLKAKLAPSLREEMKVGERKAPKGQKIMPLTAKKLMTKRVHLNVKPNITWLPVLSSRILQLIKSGRLLSNIGDAASA